MQQLDGVSVYYGRLLGWSDYLTEEVINIWRGELLTAWEKCEVSAPIEALQDALIDELRRIRAEREDWQDDWQDD